MATLREVADYAKVSAAIVSRVLNNKPGVWASEETRQRILEAARVLKYRPSASARALSTGRTMQLAISTAVPALQAGNPAELWQLLGFSDAAAAHSHRVVLMTSSNAQPKLSEYEELIDSNACDGFALFAEQLTAPIHDLLRYAEVPYVVLGDPGVDAVPHVDIDNYRYAYESVRWLAERGHRRILFAEFADSAAGADRPFHRRLRAGYFDAMEEFCGGGEPEWAPTFRTQSSEERLAMLKGEAGCTAVILPGLLDAITWEAACRANGMRIPDDVDLLCHLSTMEVSYLEPGLAFHAHDLRGMGERAGELLIGWIENGLPSTRQVLINPSPPQRKEHATEYSFSSARNSEETVPTEVSRVPSL